MYTPARSRPLGPAFRSYEYDVPAAGRPSERHGFTPKLAHETSLFGGSPVVRQPDAARSLVRPVTAPQYARRHAPDLARPPGPSPPRMGITADVTGHSEWPLSAMGQPQVAATPSGRKFSHRRVVSGIGMRNEVGPRVDIREAIGMQPGPFRRAAPASNLLAPAAHSRHGYDLSDWRAYRRVEQRARSYNTVA